MSPAGTAPNRGTEEDLVAKSSKHGLALARQNAEARFRELVAELKLLTVAFPHLRDAFDPDELPVSFLLRRGADRARTRAEAPQRRRAAAERKAGARKR
jgi:hypothetical protein